MVTYSSLPPVLGMVNSMFVDVPLPPQTRLQKLCGDILAWLNKHYSIWVREGYVTKEAMFSAFYDSQLEQAIANQKRYAIALKKRQEAIARADGGNRILDGTYLGRRGK